MLACRIIACVQIALRNDRGEACERAFPEPNPLRRTGRLHSRRDPKRFLASCAAIDPYCPVSFCKRPNQTGFEIPADPLCLVSPNPETNGRPRPLTRNFDPLRGNISQTMRTYVPERDFKPSPRNPG